RSHRGRDRACVTDMANDGDARAGACACLIQSFVSKELFMVLRTRSIVMSKSRLYSVVLMCVGMAATAGFLVRPQVAAAEGPAKKDIVETAVAAGNFKTLA